MKILRKVLIPNDLSTRVAQNKILSTKLSRIQFEYHDNNNKQVNAVQASKVGFILNLSDTIAATAKQSSVSGQINIRNN